MATRDVSASELWALIARPGIVLVDCWASWCAPCRAFERVYEATAGRHPDLTFARVDVEDERRLAARLGIQAVPTLLVFRDGILVYDEPGALPADRLERLIRGVRELDMEAVARQAERGSG